MWDNQTVIKEGEALNASTPVISIRKPHYIGWDLKAQKTLRVKIAALGKNILCLLKYSKFVTAAGSKESTLHDDQ